MFGISTKALLAGAALGIAGVGYGALKDSQAQRALRDRDAAQVSLEAARAEMNNCTARLTNVMEDAASDIEIDQIPDEGLADSVLPHWLRGPADGGPAGN